MTTLVHVWPPSVVDHNGSRPPGSLAEPICGEMKSSSSGVLN